jgi:hypothetical protein
MRTYVVLILVAAMTAMLGACGNSGVQNAALLNQPLQKGSARIKIVRTEEFMAGARGARIKLDGKEIAEDIGSGGAVVLDVAAGSHSVTVDVWDHPNVFTLNLDAKSGTIYTLEISPRGDAVAAGLFGVAGMLAEAAANKNGGLFQIKVIDTKPTGT